MTLLVQSEANSRFLYLQDLENRRLSRINHIMTGRMNCIQKTISRFTFGFLNNVSENLEKYAGKCAEIRRIRSMMQNREVSFLLPAKASALLHVQAHIRGLILNP